jgi:hypothetical protein
MTPQLLLAGRPLLTQMWRDALTVPDDQLELVSHVAACALSAGDTLTAGDVELLGEIGLAPAWRWRALTYRERRWVSACLLAKLSVEGLVTIVEMRGGSAALMPQAPSVYTRLEGAFFGDVFADTLEWNACDSGQVVADRDCALSSPTQPCQTRCGLTYVGACAAECNDQLTLCDGERQVISTYGRP